MTGLTTSHSPGEAQCAALLSPTTPRMAIIGRDRVDVVNGENLRRSRLPPRLSVLAAGRIGAAVAPRRARRAASGAQARSAIRTSRSGATARTVRPIPTSIVWALFFANPDTGSESTFITSTAGGFIAVEILVEEIRKKRRREPDAYPLVQARGHDVQDEVRRQESAALRDRRLGLSGRRARAPAPEPPKPATAAVRRRQRQRLPLRRPRAAERRLRLARRR